MQKISGISGAVAGTVPHTTGSTPTSMEKSFSSANFQVIGQQLAGGQSGGPTQAPANPAPATGTGPAPRK